MKTGDDLQRRMIALARPLTLALLAVIGVISLWTPLAHPAIAQRWFTFPNIALVRAGAGAGRARRVAAAARGCAARRKRRRSC